MNQLTRFGAILSTVLASSAAFAETAVDPATERATLNLREGNAALVQGRPEEALAKFNEAYRQLPSPKIHYNLGQAHSLIPGHEAQAYEEMSRFLDAARHADPALLVAADKQHKELRPKVGLVTVVAEPADADLLVDDINVGKVSAEWPTVLGIGTHRLAVTKNATSSEVQTITVAGGDAMEVRLRLLTSAPILTKQSDGTESKPHGLDLSDKSKENDTTETGSPFYKKWWFWGTVGAVVVAGVVTAVVLSSGKGSSNVPASALGNQGAFQ